MDAVVKEEIYSTTGATSCKHNGLSGIDSSIRGSVHMLPSTLLGHYFTATSTVHVDQKVYNKNNYASTLQLSVYISTREYKCGLKEEILMGTASL